jgi:thiol-disulfide isomerase/thioredoxin
MDTTQKIVAVVVVAVLAACAVFFVLSQQSAIPPAPAADSSVQSKITVYFFYGEECPHCHTVMPFVETLKQNYTEVDFRILETWHNETNQAISLALHQKLGIKSAGVPEVIVGNVVLTGSVDIPAKLESAIIEELKKNR